MSNGYGEDELAEEQEASESGLVLTFAEARVLGALIEKEATTPDNYPMTLNGLQNACNQKSNREPVSAFDEHTVENALEDLRGKKLAVKIHMSGSRVPKYKHTIEEVFNLDEGQRALLCVLMLRGIQTAGELNQRTERLHPFGGVPAVEHALGSLIDYPAGALVRRIPAGAGRRVVTFAHLLSGEPALGAGGTPASGPVSAEQIVLEEEASWRKQLEDEIAALRAEVTGFRAEFEALRKELE